MRKRFGGAIWSERKIRVCCIRCFLAVHVFMDAFGGIEIFNDAFGKKNLKFFVYIHLIDLVKLEMLHIVV